MRATLPRLAMMGLGALLVSSCAPIPSTSSANDDNSLPSGSPATPLPTSGPSGGQSSGWSETPASKPKKTPAALTNDEAKPTPDVADNSTTEKTAPVIKATDTADADTEPSFDNIELVDAGLGRKLGVIRVISDRTDANLLSVVAGLKNKTAHALEIEVQTIYKDKASAPLSGGAGSWIPIKLKPHEATDYRSVALSPDAVDFLVRVRLPQKPAEDQ